MGNCEVNGGSQWNVCPDQASTEDWVYTASRNWIETHLVEREAVTALDIRFWVAGVYGVTESYNPQWNTTAYCMGQTQLNSGWGSGAATLVWCTVSCASANGKYEPLNSGHGVGDGHTAFPYIVEHCGDGITECGCLNNETTYYETCDDGGNATGDGCNENCQIEPGWSCTGAPSVCVKIGGASLGLILGVSIPCGLLLLAGFWWKRKGNVAGAAAAAAKFKINGWTPLPASSEERRGLLKTRGEHKQGGLQL